MPRYFLKMNYGSMPEVEVSEEEYLKAIRSMGMYPDTTDFDSTSISGRVEKEKEEKATLKDADKHQFSPFFDQENPQIPIVGMIASQDLSPAYELNAAAVFKGKNKYLVVFVNGCSCWPDMGCTTQNVCHTKADVDKSLKGWPGLLSDCQKNNWKVKAT